MVTTLLRRNPQPYLLSFGARIDNVVRSFEIGAGTGISMRLYGTPHGDALFDRRCSTRFAEDLRPPNSVHIRASDTQRISDLFRSLSSMFQRSGQQIHLSFRKTRLRKKRPAPNDSLLLGHNIDLSALQRLTSSATLVNQATANNVPEVDWLLHCSDAANLPLESPWESAPDLFWFHCFPPFVVERRMNGVAISTDISPRNVLLDKRTASQFYSIYALKRKVRSACQHLSADDLRHCLELEMHINKEEKNQCELKLHNCMPYNFQTGLLPIKTCAKTQRLMHREQASTSSLSRRV